ncbi:MAG: SufE family protein [Pseudomonadota bacterium]
MTSFDDIVADFDFLDDWDDRYKYLIDLGRALPEFPDHARNETYKVKGCASQVWLLPSKDGEGSSATLTFQGDSDAHIVKGLVAVLLALFSGRSAKEIAALDTSKALGPLDLGGHLTPQRSNGLASMIAKIQDVARDSSES